jgi:hypothetical protein
MMVPGTSLWHHDRHLATKTCTACDEAKRLGTSSGKPRKTVINISCRKAWHGGKTRARTLKSDGLASRGGDLVGSILAEAGIEVG